MHTVAKMIIQFQEKKSKTLYNDSINSCFVKAVMETKSRAIKTISTIQLEKLRKDLLSLQLRF